MDIVQGLPGAADLGQQTQRQMAIQKAVWRQVIDRRQPSCGQKKDGDKSADGIDPAMPRIQCFAQKKERYVVGRVDLEKTMYHVV